MRRREKFGEFYRALGEYLRENPQTDNSVSLFGYGSYFDHPDKDPKDIDGGIVMPTLITDKEVVRGISKEIAKLSKGLEIHRGQIQINLLDRVSAGDGRFLSYSPDYTEFLRRHGKRLVSRPNFLEFNGIDNKFNVYESNAFNFRKARNYLLMANVAMQEGESSVMTHFSKIIDVVKRAPKKTLQLGLIRKLIETQPWPNIGLEIANLVATIGKEDAVGQLGGLVGEVDLSFYNKIRRYEDPEFVRGLLGNEEEIFQVWARAVETYEGLVKGFIDNNPPMEIKVKTII